MKTSTFTSVLMLVLLALNISAQPIVYVTQNGAGTMDGSSWGNALPGTSLQTTINTTSTPKQIWVATGIYKPSAAPPDIFVPAGSPGTRDQAFSLRNGVQVYGGFAGSESLLSQRDVPGHPTTLSGNIGDPDQVSDNCFHVVISASNDNTAILDGFIVRDGNANVNDVPVFFNGQSTLRYNAGGVYLLSSTAIIRNTIIRSCNAVNGGGGMTDKGGSPTFENRVFTGNSANAGGGYLDAESADMQFQNCVFYKNSAQLTGAGMQINSGAHLVLRNCTFAKNTAQVNGGAYFNTSDPEVTNCIFFENTVNGNFENGSANPSINYSLLQTAHAGQNNIVSDPRFADIDDGDGADDKWFTSDDGLQLLDISPAINSGTSVNATATDITGKTRLLGYAVDRGAYESDFCFSGTRLYVSSAALGLSTGSSWENAFTNVSAALYAANQCPSITEIWVAAGIYKPDTYPYGSTGGTSPRDYAFGLKDNLAIYGGFKGTESSVSERDFIRNPTILSGNIGSDNAEDNCHHVIVSVTNNETAILDGFIVSDGNANVETGSLKLKTMDVFRSFGGGICSIGSNATIRNTVFRENTARYGGGGMSYNGGSASFMNCIFTQNSAVEQGGGYQDQATSSTEFTNSVFYQNTGFQGGGLYVSETCSTRLINCTLARNFSNQYSTGYHNNGGSPVITNTISYSNTGISDSPSGSNATITYSLQQSSWPGTGNLSVNPQFVNADDPDGPDDMWFTLDDGLRLKDISPARQMGTSVGAPATDIAGRLRPVGSMPDMGAYETSSLCGMGVSRLYVKAGAAGLNNGTSWTDAFTSLSAALDYTRFCSSASEIWVAGGTYKPESFPYDIFSGSNRDYAFWLPNNVAIYGGFAGTEFQLEQRDLTIDANKSILSGDIDNNDTPDAPPLGNNTYHVMVTSGLSGSALLDGFTITGGLANGTGVPVVNGYSVDQNDGAGMIAVFSSPVLSNLRFLYNKADDHGGGMLSYSLSGPMNRIIFENNEAAVGGGFFCDHSTSVLRYVQFEGNSGQSAGGLYNGASDIQMYNSSFVRNTASDGGAMVIINATSPSINTTIFDRNTTTGQGGAIQMINTKAVVANSLFTSNSAAWGGAMYFFDSDPNITNITMYANTASNKGGAIFAYPFSYCLLRNSIIYGNSDGIVGAGTGAETAVTNSLVQGYNDGLDNLDGTLSYPNLFKDSPNGDFTLAPDSPARNRGNNLLYQPGQTPDLSAITTDLAGNARFAGIVDLGAYELPGAKPGANGIVYVKKGAQGEGTSWADAVGEVADALSAAESNPAITQIWVAKGKYLPMYFPLNSTGAAGARDYTFPLVKDVAVYGGFDGTEADVANRNLTNPANQTLLSGDIDGNDDTDGTIVGDNAYHVVIASGAMGSARLDGFSISGGQASGTGTISINGNTVDANDGGGIIAVSSSPVLANLNLSFNQASDKGAALMLYNNASNISDLVISDNLGYEGSGLFCGSSSPVLKNIVFRNNGTSAGYGGGAYCKETIVTMTNVSFLNNKAEQGAGLYMWDSPDSFLNRIIFKGNVARYGGAVYCSQNDVAITNALIVNNEALLGGAIATYSNVIHLINSTIYGNMAENGGVVYGMSNSATVFLNSLVYGNSSFMASEGSNNDFYSEYSLIQGENSVSDGNLDGTLSYPTLFSDAVNGDFTLPMNSAAANKGSNNFYDAGSTPDISAVLTDLAGNSRIAGTRIDLGAYESTTPLPVRLISFSGKLREKEIALLWHTASEENADQFEIQRSVDARNFQTLAAVKSKGNGANTYEWFDHSPIPGENFYRLKMLDHDESYSFSRMIMIRAGSVSPESLFVFPNPATNSISLGSTGISGTAEIEIHNSLGIKVKRVLGYKPDTKLDVHSLPAGVYTIMVISQNKRLVSKFIKE
jgi:hypothetical protein